MIGPGWWSYIRHDEEAGQKLLRMIDALEESDDVQQVYANFDVAEDVLRRLTAA